MLAVFAPQILLYGLAVVLYGILQAHRRFTAPALAPVLSSLVVIAAYLAFVPLGHGHTVQPGRAVAGRRADPVGRHHGRRRRAGDHRPGDRPGGCGCGCGPPCGSRPAWPGGRVALAAVGITALVAQDASVLVVTWLANGRGGQGAIVLYGYGWQVFTAAYAVLAIPIAISAFPVLAAQERQRLRRHRGRLRPRGPADVLPGRGAAGRRGRAGRPGLRLRSRPR